MAFLPLTFAQILGRMLANFVAQNTGATDVNVGSVARTIMEAAAVEDERLYVQMMEGLNDGINSSAYQAFGFSLLPATAAYGTITLTRTGGYVPDITILPSHQFKVPNTTKIYSPTTTTTWTGGAGATTQIVTVQAVNTGVSAGNTPVTSITGIVTPITGVASVTNVAAFITGADQETTDGRAARFASYIASLPRATKAAVEYGAKTTSLVDANNFVTERAAKALGVEGPVYFGNVLTASLTPVIVAANSTVEQTIAFAGVLATDIPVFITKTAAQAGLGLVNVRVPSAGNIAITYENLTGAGITPTAAESYTFTVLRNSGTLVPVVLTAALSPALVAANTTAEQTLAFSGALATDTPIGISKPTAQAGLGISMLRVPSNNNVAITFSNNTGAGITPTAAETYTLTVLRATGSQQTMTYSTALTPVSVAANTTAEQTFTFPGVLATDTPLSFIKPAAQAGLGIAGLRVTAVQTVAVTYENSSAAPIVPTAETYAMNVSRTQGGTGTVFIHNGVGTPGGQTTSGALVAAAQVIIDGTATVPGYRAAGIPVAVLAAPEDDTTIKIIITVLTPGFTLAVARANVLQAVKTLIAGLNIGDTLYTSALVSTVKSTVGVADCVLVTPSGNTIPATGHLVVSSNLTASQFLTTGVAFSANIT